jgi:hypothetical protein
MQRLQINNLRLWHRACIQHWVVNFLTARGSMVTSSESDWRELCARAAEEPDSEKLVSLVNQILQALDECDRKLMLSSAKPAPLRESH